LTWHGAISKRLNKEDKIKLVLIRHGETHWNHQRRIQGGSSDTVLSQNGRKQVKNLGLTLKDTDLSAVYSSPLQRALKTARTIAKHHGLEVQVEPDFRELEVGELEGLSIETLTSDFSHFLVQWRGGDGSEKLPGGESLVDLQKRCWSAVQRIVTEHEGTVVVVSHYFAILTIICAALGLPPSGIRRFRVSVGSLSVLDFKDGHPCLTSLGDTCHLR